MLKKVEDLSSTYGFGGVGGYNSVCNKIFIQKYNKINFKIKK